MRRILFLAVALILASLFAADSDTTLAAEKCVTETKTENGAHCSRQICDHIVCGVSDSYNAERVCYVSRTTTGEWGCVTKAPKRIGGSSGVVKGNSGTDSPQSPPGARKPTAPVAPPKKQ